MPRTSGVSGSSTEWRMRRSPIPCTVWPCVLLKPIGLLTSVIVSFFAPASFLAAFLAITLPFLGHSRADQIGLFLAVPARDEVRILQVHQAGERRPHHVVRVGRAE